MADVTLFAEAPGDVFGITVAGAGDVNGDGFDDVIVGATQNDAAGANAGRAYVYFGGMSMDAVADLTLTGEAAGDQLRHTRWARPGTWTATATTTSSSAPRRTTPAGPMPAGPTSTAADRARTRWRTWC